MKVSYEDGPKIEGLEAKNERFVRGWCQNRGFGGKKMSVSYEDGTKIEGLEAKMNASYEDGATSEGLGSKNEHFVRGLDQH